MVLEDVLQDGVGVQEVGAQDGIDAGEGGAEVFGHKVCRDAAGEGSGAIAQGEGGIFKGLEMAGICYKGRILVWQKFLLGIRKSGYERFDAFSCFCRERNDNLFIYVI